MFNNLQRHLRTLQNLKEIAVPLETDAEGYADKECPAELCLFGFKVHADDWKGIVESDEVFCPSCRHAGPARNWFTRKQVEGAHKYARGKLANGLNSAMRADAAASKRSRRRGSFISITLDVKGGRDAVLLPVAAAEPMRLRTVCENCGCRYSYVGAAYFCPSCGQNSASHTFFQTLASTKKAAGLGPILRQSLDVDDAEVMIRTLLEKAIQDTVMSFQRLSEQLYERRAGKNAPRNAFQNLDIGSELWKAELGVSYSQLIEPGALDRLRVFYQQRHLLAHQQGVVDADYVSRSGDASYSVGQRLVIREPAVLEFADLVERLGKAILDRCPSSASPP
jgi:hypothetical protein